MKDIDRHFTGSFALPSRLRDQQWRGGGILKFDDETLGKVLRIIATSPTNELIEDVKLERSDVLGKDERKGEERVEEHLVIEFINDPKFESEIVGTTRRLMNVIYEEE